MQILATLSVRNEQHYIANCLRYLQANEIKFAIIDNGSEDETSAIVARAEFKNHLVALRHVQFSGMFELRELIRQEESLASQFVADWIIHLDADEIMHSYQPQETLRAAIERLDAEGWNAINFDEFVFLPVDHAYVSEHQGWQPIRSYYFFEPKYSRLVRARRAHLKATSIESGGHLLIGENIKVAKESLALRHYIFRDQQDAFIKYSTRRYSEAEVAQGWHSNRRGFKSSKFRFPPSSKLHTLVEPSDRDLCRKNPQVLHYWEW